MDEAPFEKQHADTSRCGHNPSFGYDPQDSTRWGLDVIAREFMSWDDALVWPDRERYMYIMKAIEHNFPPAQWDAQLQEFPLVYTRQYEDRYGADIRYKGGVAHPDHVRQIVAARLVQWGEAWENF